MKLTAAQSAQSILDACKSKGWTPYVRGSILTITKRFQAGSNDEFCIADSEYWDILSRLPATRPGSTWGTDGGGMGAMSAMNSGLFKMHKSGGSKRVLNALSKLI